MMKSPLPRWRSLLAAGVAIAAVPAWAQDGGGQGGVAAAPTPASTAADPAAPSAPTTYSPDYFARFAPRTALDMVEQIPDFTLTDTSDNRGIGQASQNILVNGARVSGKSNDAETTLQQIAASSVERIEILDGAQLGIPGLSGRVANVVVRSRALSVQFNWDSQYRRNVPDQLTVGGISASGRIGASDITLSLSNDNGLRRGGQGPEIVTNSAGAITLSRFERDTFIQDRPRLAGTLSRTWDDGSVLNLNLSGERLYYTSRFDALATPASGGPSVRELFIDRRREWNVEGGGDYEFALGGGKLKLILLESFSRNPTFSTFTELASVPGSVRVGDRFDQDSDSGETVLRSEYSWSSGGADWQIALEGAYNFLDLTSRFATLLPDDTLIPIPLPGGDSFVDEWRSEVQITRGWSLARALTVQLSVGGEFSRIRQTSAGGLSRSFVRPKGRAALTWTASPRLTATASLERRVGQLSFFDFTAAVDLLNGVANAGNVNLVPEQAWRLEGEVTRSLGGAGSLTLGGYWGRISDIVDRIPISATDEGIGNLPRARRLGVIARGTVLLDKLGLRGVRLNLNGEFARSRVADPVTGAQRKISGDLIHRWSVEFRHDIPGTQFAWGGLISEDVDAPTFRLNQTFRSNLTKPVTQIYVEHKDVFGLTVRAGLRNLLGTSDDIGRDVFVNRRDGPIAFRERQIRNIHLLGTLSISGSF